MRFGIDLGGTKIELCALAEAGDAEADNDKSGSIVLRQRVDTPQGDYPGTLDAIARLVADAEVQLGQSGSIGIGTPGAISPASGLLKNSNSVCLNGQPLWQDLEQRLGRPVRLANDADCFALSEASDGAAMPQPGQDRNTVFGVIIGTGVGAGVVVDGRPLSGPNAIAGEWGHNPLPWPQDEERPGPDCYCGLQGCIETFLSGPGMERDHRADTGRDWASREIVVAAESGDPAAQACLERYAHRLARSLAHVINVLDPHVIVLGGGMSNLDYLYQRVPEIWGHYAFTDTVLTRLVRNRYGDSSGVRGAAWLWPDQT